MSNPFTKFLRQWSRNSSLEQFVTYWDDLERIVVQVYRQKIGISEARPEFERIWPWLRRRYPDWEPQLRPFWQQTRAAGQTTQTDPFQLLLDIQQPEDIRGNWRAMQHLPAAREALNRFLVAES